MSLPEDLNRRHLDDVMNTDEADVAKTTDPSDRGDLEISLTHDLAESVESGNRAHVALVGWGPLPVSRASVGSAGFPPQYSS